MNILVTGGAGFIGSHIAEALLKRGDKVTIIDDLSTGKFSNIAHLVDNKNFNYKIDTIMDIKVMDELISKSNIVYHFAAAVGVQFIIDNPLRALEVNIRGSDILLELANKHKKKVVLASTSEIYGKSNEVPFKENADRLLGSTTISRWGYSTGKAVDEFLALAYHREKKLPVVIARLFNTVGPRQSAQYGMVIPRFVKQALLEHPLYVYGDGQQSRCFSYVDDIVRGVIGLADLKEAEGEIFNVGNDEEITILELAEKIKALVNSSSPIELVPYEKAYEQGFEDMRRRMPDLTKIKSYINYEPRVKLDEILQRVIEYFESNIVY